MRKTEDFTFDVNSVQFCDTVRIKKGKNITINKTNVSEYALCPPMYAFATLGRIARPFLCCGCLVIVPNSI